MKSVLVIGGGIAGIQSALDLAEMGIKVFLLERKPAIGGTMAQLDKTFPTNDCSICILSPKLTEVARHSLIELLSYSELVSIKGNVGNYKVLIGKKPRYVREEECIGCGKCIEKCPSYVLDEFNCKLSRRKAIYRYFLQGIPAVATIDAENCLYFKKDGKCGACKKTCEKERKNAIDFNQKYKELEFVVGAIVVATGSELYNLSELPQYGYGIYPNVISSLQYERLICANGPTGGNLIRPSDGKEVNLIGFVQCVASRNFKMNRYCSSVCCMHSTKEAILAKEHNPDIKSFIFYTDMRASGKGFMDYIERAKKEYNVEYIRTRIAEITQEEDLSPVLWYEDIDSGKVNRMKVDLSVLASGIVPSSGVEDLARKLSVELDEYKFFKVNDLCPTDTTREGIFVCGCCAGPMDISESVIMASAAAKRAFEAISDKSYP